MSYDLFADYYDRLMEDVDYPARTDYLLALFAKHDRKPTLLLDAACGTGGFALEFSRRGWRPSGPTPRRPCFRWPERGRTRRGRTSFGSVSRRRIWSFTERWTGRSVVWTA